MLIHVDGQKSKRLHDNRKRGIGSEEAQEIFTQPFFAHQRLPALLTQCFRGLVGNNPNPYLAAWAFAKCSAWRGRDGVSSTLSGVT